PRWSPDGQRIAFESTQDRAPSCYFPDICRDIWVMNADRSNVTRLTRHETPRDGYAYSPTWSPDGSEIAFANVRLSGDVWVSEIWVMKSDGTNARPVTPINGCCTGVVAWSPDGTEIAYDDG